jgi:hypothetical protein
MAYNLNTDGSRPSHQAGFEIRPGRSVHHVKPGETLDSIAKQYNTSSGTLIALNSHQLGGNGLGLSPGMRLEI